MGQAQAPQLPAHDGRVVLHGDGRVLAGVDRVLLGGQPEGVEAERVQHVMPGHAQVPAEHVGADVPQRMADVQPDAAGIGEEVQQVELGPPGHAAEPGRQSAAGAVRVRRAWNVPSRSQRSCQRSSISFASRASYRNRGVPSSIGLSSLHGRSGNEKAPHA